MRLKNIFRVGVVGMIVLSPFALAQEVKPAATAKPTASKPSMTTSIPDSLEPTAEVKNVGSVKVTGSTSKVPKAPIDRAELKQQIMLQLGIRPGANITIEFSDDGPQLDADAEEIPVTDKKPAVSPSKEGEAAKSVGRVEVKGAREDFRDTTKMVIGADQLTDPSDRNLLDVLDKQSGIIVREDGVSINGLPPSYTQVLYDGRKFPAGMGLSTLRPDQIERIEISFGADASQSAGGMAGTINVIPKKKISKRSGNIGINEVIGARVNHGLFAAINDRFANGSNYSAFGNLSRSENSGGYERERTWRNIDGESGAETLIGESDFSGTHRSVNGRSNWILPDGSWLGASLNLTRSENEGGGEDYFLVADDRRIRRGQSAYESSSRSWSPEITYDRTLSSNFSLKTSARYSDYSSESTSRYVFADSFNGSSSRSVSDTQSRFADVMLIYAAGEGRELQVGGSTERTDDTTLNTIDGAVEYFRRRETWRGEDAIFVKWAQRVSSKIGLNTGLRWTSLTMKPTTVVAPSQPYHYSESFLTPSLNLSYRQNAQNTWAFNYSRTFKPPQQSNLDMSDGAPSVTEVNRPLNAIYRGNAFLKAEVTDSIIGTFSRRWTAAIDSNINVSYRRLENPITTIILEENDIWYQRPMNLDSTEYFSVSVSGKYWRTFGTDRRVTVLITPSITKSWNHINGVNTDVDGFGEFIPLSAYLGVQLKQGPVVAKFRINYTSSVWTFGGLQAVNYEESTTTASFNVSWAATPKLVIGAGVSGLGGQRDGLSRTIYRDGVRFMSIESRSVPNTFGPTLSVNANYRF